MLPRPRSIVLVLTFVVVACADEGRPSGTPFTTTTSTLSDTAAESDGSDGSEGSTSSSSASSTSPTTTVSTTTSADDDTGTAATTLPDDTSGSTAPSETSGSPSTICDDLVGEELIVPDTCDGPNGNTSTEVPSNGLYATSWFGCYMEEDGDIYQDPSDDCEFACGSQGMCPDGQDGPTCEANLRWFAADADRYGCGGRIRVTNCENGNAVVLVTLDRGPNCNTVEMECAAPVLDMSHDAMVYLFDGGIFGGCDHQTVVVEAVDEGVPLGPV